LVIVPVGLVLGASPLTLEAVYRAHAPKVARWAARLAGPSEDVEDLVHEVFLVVEQKLPGFSGEAHVSTWLYRITANVVRAQRRKQRLRRWLLGPDPEAVAPADPRPSLEVTTDAKAALSRVYRALDRLKERDRTLLILHQLEGLDAQAISELTGTKPGTIWVQLHRARAALERAYEEVR
jgi:RNA polymerase sigma-70 factor, ECF subfamily